MRRGPERGQTIVLFALAAVALLAMVSLVVDGGNAFAQQRATQNASDAASEAGAVVLADSILSVASGGAPRTDAEVLAAVEAAAAANAVKPFAPGFAGNSQAFYTDILGNMLTPAGAITTSTASAAQVGGGTIPSCTSNCTQNRASGVLAYGSRDFSTFLGGLIGLGQFRATAQATAVTGYKLTPCDSDQGCSLLPVTFAINMTSCDGTGDAVYTNVPWTVIPEDVPLDQFNESILTLCKNGPGAVGWLDLPGGQGNLGQQITTPTHDPIPIPTWLQTQPGNPNNLDAELSAYWGDIVGVVDDGDKVVLIPFFDATCNQDRPDNEAPVFPGGAFPGVCSGGQPGNGNNTWYHIPYFIGFLLDRTYTQGANNPQCNQAPGLPFSVGNGGTGCFKGWYVQTVTAPGPVTSNPPPSGQNAPVSVQLIK